MLASLSLDKEKVVQGKARENILTSCYIDQVPAALWLWHSGGGMVRARWGHQRRKAATFFWSSTSSHHETTNDERRTPFSSHNLLLDEKLLLDIDRQSLSVFHSQHVVRRPDADDYRPERRSVLPHRRLTNLGGGSKTDEGIPQEPILLRARDRSSRISMLV